MAAAGRAGRGSRGAAGARVADARNALFFRPDGRCPRVRRVGPTYRRRRLDRQRRLLPGAALSLFRRRGLLAVRPRPGRAARGPGLPRLGVLRAGGLRGEPADFEAGGRRRRLRAGVLCAGDLLRRPGPEVGPRRAVRVGGAGARGVARRTAGGAARGVARAGRGDGRPGVDARERAGAVSGVGSLGLVPAAAAAPAPPQQPRRW